MARSKTPFVNSRPRAGTQAGAISLLRIQTKVKAELTGFKQSRLQATDNLLVSDSAVFVCKVGEGIIGSTSPMGEGKLIPFAEHICSVYRNNTGVCLLCGSKST